VETQIPAQSRPVEREWRYILPRWIGRGTVYLVAILIALVSIAPFLWTISTSLKAGRQVRVIPPKLIPAPPVFENYRLVFNGMGGNLPVARWLRNSVFLTSVNIVGQILFAAIAGFGFSRFRFRLRKVMFAAMLSSAIVPGMVRMLPQYLMFARWGWTNTYLPLTIPTWLGNLYLPFLFHQYFATIPRSLDESARVDGASNLVIFLRIMLPLSKPLLATAMVMVFVSSWNDFLGPFIYLQNMEKFTLAVGLRYFQNYSYSGLSREPMLSAYAIIMAAPVIAVFFLFQRYFVQGIQLSVAKE
jgi:multiple sugar transport system permease protein